MKHIFGIKKLKLTMIVLSSFVLIAGQLISPAWAEDPAVPDDWMEMPEQAEEDEPIREEPEESPCFIATAAYGSSAAPEVVALRGFRDGLIISSASGRLFADAYYMFSPVLSAAVDGDGMPGYVIRLHLAPMVVIAERFLNIN